MTSTMEKGPGITSLTIPAYSFSSQETPRHLRTVLKQTSCSWLEHTEHKTKTDHEADALAGVSPETSKKLPKRREATVCTWIKTVVLQKVKHSHSLWAPSSALSHLWDIHVSCFSTLSQTSVSNKPCLLWPISIYLPGSHTLDPPWLFDSNWLANHTKFQDHKLSGAHISVMVISLASLLFA